MAIAERLDLLLMAVALQVLAVVGHAVDGGLP